MSSVFTTDRNHHVERLSVAVACPIDCLRKRRGRLLGHVLRVPTKGRSVFPIRLLSQEYLSHGTGATVHPLHVRRHRVNRLATIKRWQRSTVTARNAALQGFVTVTVTERREFDVNRCLSRRHQTTLPPLVRSFLPNGPAP
jgi:hypothetical protein